MRPNSAIMERNSEPRQQQGEQSEQKQGEQPNGQPTDLPRHKRARQGGSAIIYKHIKNRIAMIRQDIRTTELAWNILIRETPNGTVRTTWRKIIERRIALDAQSNELYNLQDICFPNGPPKSERISVLTRQNHPWTDENITQGMEYTGQRRPMAASLLFTLLTQQPQTTETDPPRSPTPPRTPPVRQIDQPNRGENEPHN